VPFISSTRGNFGPQGKQSSRPSVVASGGTMTSASGYISHTFNNSGTFTLTSVPSGTTFDFLMVAGGGAGGTGNGNNSSHPAGGAGGLIYRTGQTLSAGNYSITVGNGGVGAVAGSNAGYGNPGENTTFNGLTALGGGPGQSGQCCTIGGQSGGSGGGAQHSDNVSQRTGGAATQPGSASGGFGNKGGDGPTSSNSSPCWVGGGGGGAGGEGLQGAPTNTANAGLGGIGRQYDISGVNKYYAGGGSGGTNQSSGCACYMGNPGALGGGGNGYGGVSCGQSPDRFRHGGDGHGNLGGGGGGATSGTEAYLGGALKGGSGGKGVVIIRYLGNPLSAPQNVPGLQVWLDASTSNNFTFSSGTTISSWVDKSGNGHNATATNGPTWVSGAKNGLGVVRFVDTSAQYFSNSEMQHARERTVFIVRKFGSAIDGKPVIGFPTRITDTWRGLYIWSNSEYGFNSWNGDSYGTNSFSTSNYEIDAGTWREPIPDSAGNVNWTSSNFSLRINGSAKTLSVSRSSLQERQQYLNGYYIARGGAPGGVQHLNGDIGEILIYDRVLTIAEQQTVEAYLTSKWGI
jgi:hypothetical protein